MIRGLILGAAGFIGNYLLEELQNKFEILACVYNKEHSSSFRGEGAIVDITRPGHIENAIYHFNPEFIVNLAGSKSVAECENNPDAAYQINVAGVRNVSRLAKRYNIRFIHLSTDMIFDGKKGNYSENDAPCPMTVYAKTKYQGEEAALSLGTNTLILRSALCFGMPLGKNHSFSDWLESGFTKSKKMNLFKDQYRTPVYVRDLCRLVAKCIPSKLTGILHAAGDDKVDRVEFARIYAKARGYSGKYINAVELNKVKSDFYLQRDISMINKKAKREFKIRFTNIEKACLQISNDYKRNEANSGGFK